jgi:putative aldouronate transport system permease protein
VAGGMIPSYLLVKSLNLIDTYSALILPGAISAYNVVIARNFFMSLPDSIEESAKIDGANDILILFAIIVPVSLPIITTLILWIAVGHWNAWFDSLIYSTKPAKQVLQIVMRRVVLEGTQQMLNFDSGEEMKKVVNPETIKATVVMVTTIPIICVYPFLQKYFVKGVMVGSIKG